MENEQQLNQEPFQQKQTITMLQRQEGLKKKKQLFQKALQMGISKNQMKKLQKKQQWEQMKQLKRKQKRQKQREKKKEMKKEVQKKEQNQEQNNISNLNQNEHQVMKKRKDQYQQKMIDNLKVVIDLQFYDLMTQKQLNSLVKQLSYCHAINRKVQNPFNYILTSMTQDRQSFIDKKYNGTKWGIKFLQQSVHEAFKIQQLVYLTGDAEEEIQQFDQNKIYVIGGIVDHNRLKKITFNYAQQHKIQAKRLPFNNVKLKSNVHLAVNHVWEWMLRKYNGQTWDQSLQKVLPQRKIQKVADV